MEYTGKYKKVHSDLLGEEVYILEYKSKDSYPYCDCDRCGKPIIKKMYVIQNCETDVEMMYLGSECIKHFS